MPRERSSLGLTSIALAMSCMIVSGCATHLYNAENDKQAAALKEKVVAAKFDDTFKVARENHAALSAAIAATATSHAQTTAKLQLFAAVGTPLDDRDDGLRAMIRSDWTDLAGAAASANRDLLNTIEKGIQANDPGSPAWLNVRARGYDVRLSGLSKVPECVAKIDAATGLPVIVDAKVVVDMPSPDDIVKTIPAPVPVSLKPNYTFYRQKCESVLMARQAMDSLFPADRGNVGRALDAWRQSAAAQSAARGKAQALKSKYDALDKQYQDALDKIKSGLPNAEETAKDLLKQAGNALEALASIQETDQAKKFGLQLASKERIAKLEAILSALAGSEAKADDKTLTESTRKRLAAIAGIPAIVDDVASLYAAAETARLTPLKFELAYHQQVLNAAQRDIDLERQEAEALREVYLAYTRMAYEIGLASETLAKLPAGARYQRPPFQILSDAATTASEKASLNTALIAFYRAHAKYGASLRAAELAGPARTFHRNLIADETAIAEWKTLIEGEATILAEYHAGGIKPESLGQLASVLALIAIAIGVN